MDVPKIGFGAGFLIRKNPHNIGAKPVPVNISNGMPIVSNKQVMVEKHRQKVKQVQKDKR